MTTRPAKQAVLHRMVMENHVSPYGTKARDLLRRRGYRVDDRWLTMRAQTDAFKAEHGSKRRRRPSSMGSASAGMTTCGVPSG